MNKKLLKTSFLNTLGTTAYIGLVGWLMSNGNKLFGTGPSIISMVAFLLLFVLSALVTSSLVLGRPIYVYLEGQKKEASKLLIYTIIWLLVFTLSALGYLVIRNI